MAKLNVVGCKLNYSWQAICTSSILIGNSVFAYLLFVNDIEKIEDIMAWVAYYCTTILFYFIFTMILNDFNISFYGN